MSNPSDFVQLKETTGATSANSLIRGYGYMLVSSHVGTNCIVYVLGLPRNDTEAARKERIALAEKQAIDIQSARS